MSDMWEGFTSLQDYCSKKTRIFQCSQITMLRLSSSVMFFGTTIFSARLVSHEKNSSTKEASSSDGEESLSKIFSKKFCVLFCGSYSCSGLSFRLTKLFSSSTTK